MLGEKQCSAIVEYFHYSPVPRGLRIHCIIQVPVKDNQLRLTGLDHQLNQEVLRDDPDISQTTPHTSSPLISSPETHSESMNSQEENHKSLDLQSIFSFFPCILTGLRYFELENRHPPIVYREIFSIIYYNLDNPQCHHS